MLDSRICECGKETLYFKEEDAGKVIKCPVCDRTYMVFLEYEDDGSYDLFAEPEQQLLLD